MLALTNILTSLPSSPFALDNTVYIVYNLADSKKSYILHENKINFLKLR